MFQSINPFTQEIIARHHPLTALELNQHILSSDEAFKKWKLLKISDRAILMLKLAKVLREEKERLSILITSEMGKVISESRAEIEKCAWLCDYYAENSEEMLKKEFFKTDASESYARFDPIGVIYAIMPWNFPFWQVLRFAIPTLMAGNTVMLKHAPNVLGCAKAIEELFVTAGFPENVFSNLVIPLELSDNVIVHPLIQGVTITGSDRAGRAVAAQAGKHLKKCVLELGGSDPYIVLADADIKNACKTGTASRMLNNGQVCIAAKRFIVEESIFDQFVEEQKFLLEKLKPGNPLNEKTDVGPMARPDLLDGIERQVNESLKMGAKLITGGVRVDDSFYTPTLLIGVKKGMPVYDEETFGPVSVVIPAKDAVSAVRIANDTSFGLGASIWTSNLELAREMAVEIEAGAVFINGMTKSDPRLPFGGIKNSGYGRELSHFGMMEFVNIKTVWIK